MAYGYAAASGRPGVYCAVPGPGFLNTTAALATAYACNAPVVCLSGQVPPAASAAASACCTSCPTSSASCSA